MCRRRPLDNPPPDAHRRVADLEKNGALQLVLAETNVRSAVTVADHFIDLLGRGTGSIPALFSEAFLGYVAICYARPFSHSRKSSVQSLPAKWGKFSDPILQHAHNKMIGYRHTLFAHSDPSERTLLIVPDGGNFMGEIVKEGIGWAINDKTLKPESIIQNSDVRRRGS